MNIQEESQRVMRAVLEELDSCKAALESEHVTWRGPDLIVWSRDPGEYSAEIKVEFEKNENLFDVFELIVFQDGVMKVSVPEIRSWVRENLPGVVDRSRKL